MHLSNIAGAALRNGLAELRVGLRRVWGSEGGVVQGLVSLGTDLCAEALCDADALRDGRIELVYAVLPKIAECRRECPNRQVARSINFEWMKLPVRVKPWEERGSVPKKNSC